MNPGKAFEDDFKKSISDDYFYYRFRDGTAAWGGNEKVRFQQKNICDCMVMAHTKVWLMELKSTKAKSIPFGMINMKNLEDLVKASQHRKANVKAVLVANFRSVARTFYMDAQDVKRFIETTDRKSIPISFFEEEGTEIESVKRRVRYRYKMFD